MQRSIWHYRTNKAKCRFRGTAGGDDARPTREIRIMRDERLTLATWVAIGAGVGVALGLAMDNLALWLAIGVGIGLAIGAGQSRMGRK